MSNTSHPDIVLFLLRVDLKHINRPINNTGISSVAWGGNTETSEERPPEMGTQGTKDQTTGTSLEVNG